MIADKGCAERGCPMHNSRETHGVVMVPKHEWVGLTDDEKRSVCRVGPVYAPDGVVTRKPLEYRKELEGVALMAVRQADSLLREKNGGKA